MKILARLLICSLLLTPAAALRADPPKEADLATRVQQLEKRVAELEAALKKVAAEPAKTESENKLVGTWAVADASRGEAVFTDLVLKADGRCDVVIRSTGSRPNAKYKVIGKQLVVEIAMTGGLVETWGQCRIASVDDKELLLEHPDGNLTRKVKYVREK